MLRLLVPVVTSTKFLICQYGSKVLDQNFNLVKNNNYSVVRTPSTFKLSLNDVANIIGYIEVNLVQYEHALIFDNVTVL